MRRLWTLLALAALACSDQTLNKTLPIASSALPGTGEEVESSDLKPRREAIPAEWTVAEDTSANGEVTVESLQLPSSREIQGLSGDSSTRLVLRCLDGRVTAFIARDSEADDTASDSVGGPDVQVQLDSAPACE